MAKIDQTVLKETRLTALATLLLTVVMHLVFICGGWWNIKVLWGSLLGAVTAVADFFLMGLTVQKAVSQEQKSARNTIRLSQQGRLLMKGAVLCLAFAVQCFHPVAAVLPLFFPGLHVRVRPLWDKSVKRGTGESGISIDAIENGSDESRE